MKGLKALAAIMLVSGLLVSAAPATAGGQAAYKHYVGCGLSQKAKPSHVCPKNSKKGAFFKSLDGAVVYSVCVRFPGGKTLCASHQPQKGPPEQGTLYVNKITSTNPGKHVVTWFVKGKKVGSWTFKVAG